MKLWWNVGIDVKFDRCRTRDAVPIFRNENFLTLGVEKLYNVSFFGKGDVNVFVIKASIFGNSFVMGEFQEM